MTESGRANGRAGVSRQPEGAAWERNRRRWQREFACGATVVEARPAWITLDTGSVCNLRCLHCPRENPTTVFHEQPADPMLADRLKEHFSVLQRLTLHGLGEPLLSEVFWEIVEDERASRIPTVEANTNGTLLSESNVERLLASNLNQLNISVDGATPETYTRIRGASFEKVIAGIRRLTRRRRNIGRLDFRVWIVTTLMTENIRELPQIVDLACDLGVDSVWAQHLDLRSDGLQDGWHSTRHGWSFSYREQHLSTDPKLSNSMVRSAQERAALRGFSFKCNPEVFLPESGLRDPAAVPQLTPGGDRPISECHQPWEWLVIDPLGGVYPCCFSSRKVGELRQHTLEEIWNGPAMVDLRSSICDGYINRICRGAGCRFVQETEKAYGLEAYDLSCEVGQEVSLRIGGRTDHLLSGWSDPEEWGTWSDGETATMLMMVREKRSNGLRLEVLCRGAIDHVRPRSCVDVEVNGRQLERWEFRRSDEGAPSIWQAVEIPGDVLTSSRLETRFRIETPLSPTAWGGSDGRMLGIGVSAFRICAPASDRSDRVPGRAV